MTVAPRALQTASLVLYLGAIWLSALVSLPQGVLLPNHWFYIAFWTLPGLAAFVVVWLLRNGSTPTRLVSWVASVALALLVVGVQLRLLVAHALSLGESGLGGLLSNFHVTAYAAFQVPLLVGAMGALFLALVIPRWASAICT